MIDHTDLDYGTISIRVPVSDVSGLFGGKYEAHWREAATSFAWEQAGEILPGPPELIDAVDMRILKYPAWRYLTPG